MANSGPDLTLQQTLPLQQTILRNLGDRSYDKRKNAALDIENLIKQLQETGDTNRIRDVITVLGKDFACSTNANHRKGGLIGLAATAIGLMTDASECITRLHTHSRTGDVFIVCFYRSHYPYHNTVSVVPACFPATHLDQLTPPVLRCFDDPESRVRYYACESLYNIAKVDGRI